MLAAATLCFANASGGSTVVGVRNEPGGPDAFVGTTLDPREVKQRIFEQTVPPLAVDVEAIEFRGAANTRIPHFVAQLPDEERADVDALLILYALCHRQSLTAVELASLLQKRPESAQAALERLAQDRIALVEPSRGTARRTFPKYRLREHVRQELGTAVRYNRRSVDQTDRRVIAHVREDGKITNRTVRDYFDVDVARARDILRDLVKREILVKTSEAERGPSVTYGPGARFPSEGRSR